MVKSIFEKKDIYVSSITIAELEYGVAKSSFPEKNKIALIEFLSIFNILAFDDTDAVEFGMIKTDLENKLKDLKLTKIDKNQIGQVFIEWGMKVKQEEIVDAELY